ncbi:hypothetical protein BELL_0001g00390 [Botrytis elliptica]|uniref:Uncharacterized protein n=1 Tax=Botrytis elliptica TaxID=278938 RepID=A0A4Z1K546_9HELO|nr:hypothetical protein BELL_0001g00390 [Botrytis elliptica]
MEGALSPRPKTPYHAKRNPVEPDSASHGMHKIYMHVIEPSKADIEVVLGIWIGGRSKAIIFIINHIACHLHLMPIFNAEPNVNPVSCRSVIIPVAELGALDQERFANAGTLSVLLHYQYD